MNLKQILPDTPQKEAVIARSRQLTDFKWTPVCDVPTYLTLKECAQKTLKITEY